jgi:hypothetical protein
MRRNALRRMGLKQRQNPAIKKNRQGLEKFSRIAGYA